MPKPDDSPYPGGDAPRWREPSQGDIRLRARLTIIEVVLEHAIGLGTPELQQATTSALNNIVSSGYARIAESPSSEWEMTVMRAQIEAASEMITLIARRVALRRAQESGRSLGNRWHRRMLSLLQARRSLAR